VESGKGTLGMMVNDRDLYSRMIQTLSSMDSLIADIKADPKKYVHVSLF
jgi:phospholipid/cholesterol/gamma-HCH transport system substrate-binding protein